MLGINGCVILLTLVLFIFCFHTPCVGEAVLSLERQMTRRMRVYVCAVYLSQLCFFRICPVANMESLSLEVTWIISFYVSVFFVVLHAMNTPLVRDQLHRAHKNGSFLAISCVVCSLICVVSPVFADKKFFGVISTRQYLCCFIGLGHPSTPTSAKNQPGQVLHLYWLIRL